MKHCPECGCLLTKPRSIADHRRFFGMIGKAFTTWPETHEFRPSDAEHLRAYLLVECGYADATPVFVELDCFPEDQRATALKLVSLTVEASVAAALSQGAYAFVRIVGDTITVFRPKSINFQTLCQRDFGPLREAVEGVVETALGCTAEELLRAEAA